MRRLDRAGAAALTLTGVVFATAVGVAVTASARSAQSASTGTNAEKTIQLVNPRPSAAPSPLLFEDARALPPSISAVDERISPGTTTVTRPPSGTQSAPVVRSTEVRRSSVSTTAPDEPSGSGAASSGPGDTRGDGTREDDDRDDDDDDRSGHRGGDDDDSEKDNSGPGNYENPGRSNSGGDD
jgi:hypothetical protein